MAQTPTNLFAGAGTVSQSVLYTVPTGKTLVLKQVAIGTGGTATTWTLILGGIVYANSIPIAANSLAILDLSTVLTAGQTINGSMGAAVGNWRLDGLVSP